MLRVIITFVVIVVEAVVTAIIAKKFEKEVKQTGKGAFCHKLLIACGILSTLTYLLTSFVNTYFIILIFFPFGLGTSMCMADKILGKKMLLSFVSVLTTVFAVIMAGIVLVSISVTHSTTRNYSVSVSNEMTIPFNLSEDALAETIFEELTGKSEGEYNITVETKYSCTYRHHENCTCTDTFICSECYPYAVPRKQNVTID